jgi:hypothetical protein
MIDVVITASASPHLSLTAAELASAQNTCAIPAAQGLISSLSRPPPPPSGDGTLIGYK